MTLFDLSHHRLSLLHFFFAVTILTLTSCPLYGQKDGGKRVTLTGHVKDSQSGEELSMATVQILKSDSSSMVTGAVSSATGVFNIKNVPEGNYVVKVSYIGYHNFLRPITVKPSPAEQSIGTILLTPSSVMLQTAVVQGTMKQVEVKEDTVIFNADAFKVPEGSVLEELIRKLPGAEVGDDGSIKINGKTVKKILVEGKEFFSSDKNMAMKNLPSEIVDKVKTYDKQSDLSRITGIDDGEEETVIDLSIKKGMKQGWFGNADLGYGSEKRFAERVNVNRFADKMQASVIGSINNTNDQTGGGGGRGGNNGVTTSGMAGGNIALDLNKVEVGGNVRYNHRKSDARSYSSSQNFVSTKASFSNNRRQSISRNGSMNGDFKIEWKPDSMTTLLLRPSFSVGSSSSESNGLSATFNSDPYANGISEPLSQIDLLDPAIRINRNQSRSINSGDNYNLNANLMLNRRLNSHGRNASVRLSAAHSNNENSSYNMSNVDYYQRDSTDLTYRYRTTPSYNTNMSLGFTYTEPILRNLFLQFNYNYQYSKRHSDGSTYDFAKLDEVGRELIDMYGFGNLPANYEIYLSDLLSRYTENVNHVHNLELSARYLTSKINLNVGVQMQPQRQQMTYQYQGLDTIASRTFSRISPTLNMRYRFSRQHQLRLTYRGNTQQPEMTDLFNLTDNSNPLNIREGNPALKPSFTNNINLDYNNYIAATSQSIFGRFSFSNTLNATSNRTEYNPETGGQTSRPENINGRWNINGNVGFNTPVIWDFLIINTSTSASYNNNVGFIYQNHETFKNTVRHSTLGERLSITLRRDFFDIVANGSINYSKSRSDLVTTSNQDTYSFNYGMSTNFRFDNGISFSTNIGMHSRRGYSSAEMNTNELIWNAQASYRFLKRKQATISLHAYDILHQRSNISRSISAYSRTDTETNSINSYVMAHFIYRLNMFGNRQTRQNMRSARQEGNYGEGRGGYGEGRGYGGGRGNGGGGYGRR